MVAMLFILFDVEAVFMLPWAVVYRDLPQLTGVSRMFGFWEMLVYLGFVLVGFFYVWKKGILDWASTRLISSTWTLPLSTSATMCCRLTS